MHESLDVTLERVTQWIWNRALLFTLLTTNFVSNAFNKVYEYSSISLQGALNAHKEEVWLFTGRNTLPWVSFVEDYRGKEYPIIYYPRMNHIIMNKDNTSETKSFDDVVLANMSKRDGSVNVEMSSTFHKISWSSSGDSPSLYEVALIHCLSHRLLFTDKEMDEFTLEILTTDTNTVSICMQDAKGCFSGWDNSSQASSEFKNSIYKDDLQDNSESEERPKID
jgi:hypothetical protein